MGVKYSKRVWRDKKLKGGKLLVMLALADHATDDGDSWPGMSLLTDKTRLTDRQIRRVLNTLETDGYITIEERAIGRGKRPHYKLFPNEKADILSDQNEEKADIFDNKSGHFVHEKADIFDTNQSRVRREPITEPLEEPKGESAPARVLRSRNRNGSAVDTIAFKSPHVDNSHFDLDTGYIATGQGVTAVEVYYERFDVAQREARLNAIKEDDLMQHCLNLDQLREVVTAYSRTTYLPGNLQLILDWYHKGVPEKYKNEPNGAKNGSYQNGNGAHYERPPASQHSMEQHKRHDAKRRAAGRPY